ncbi:MAG: HAMP domain-containing histidine kinase [Rhodospirillum sp.]|nr:HAMP domain-containing histidine kinase [Rhodospirillum sp.]MCF8500976.1 HAMP domain-containing histidine kinase [Rhodospirillum sp.]
MAISILWILLSDKAVASLFPEITNSTLAQSVKGIGFVLATSILLFLLIRRELRYRIRVERELERAMNQTVQLNAQLSRFAHATTHELIEPTRSMAGFACLLERRLGDQLSPENQEMLQFLKQGAKRMHRLVSDTATYASLDGAPRDAVTFSLELPFLNAMARLKRDDIVLDHIVHVISPDPPEVNGDPLLLEAVFVNLLSNARQYTDPARPMKIEVEWKLHEDKRIEVDIRDNGRGIPKDHRDNVFLPFFTLKQDGDTKAGSGFGLPACRRIIEWHGGTIEALASPMGGTTIRFILPRQARKQAA